MLSKATFDLDAHNNSILKLEITSTSDLRDKVAQRFIESLGHVSQWGEILPCGNNEYWIFPLKPDELRRAAATMIERADELDAKTKKYTLLVEESKQ